MKKILLALSIALVLFSCDDDSKSDLAIITNFTVSNVGGELVVKDIQIDGQYSVITVIFDHNLASSDYPVSFLPEITLSEGASISPSVGQLSFSTDQQTQKYTVKAEDGSVKDWFVFIRHKQLPNSDFENWYETSGIDGKAYKEPGLDNNSIWITANLGTSMYGVYGATPLTIELNTLAVIKTDSTSQIPITAGTIYTGKFDFQKAISNPTDPVSATVFGTPFAHRPVSVKVKYKYQAGEDYIQATVKKPGNIFGGFDVKSIDGEDECKIYAILEAVQDDMIMEVGRATMISGTTSDVMMEKTFDFNYDLDMDPTRITVVFTSSKDGDYWRGAVGSILTVDDLELVY